MCIATQGNTFALALKQMRPTKDMVGEYPSISGGEQVKEKAPRKVPSTSSSCEPAALPA